MTPPVDETPLPTLQLKKEKLIVHEWFKNKKRPNLTMNMKQAVQAFMTVKMPPRFSEILQEENFLCPRRANRWILEYKKFLALQYFVIPSLIPSETVEIVWLLHCSFMPHYRRMTERLFGNYYPHQCTMMFGVTEQE